MSELNPNTEVIANLTADPSEGRFAIVLLVSYEDDELYTQWIDEVLGRLEAVGARIVWAANAAAPIVGDPDRDWDIITVVEYPSLDAFLAMVGDERWPRIDGLRMRAMSRNEVYGCTPVIDALS